MGIYDRDYYRDEPQGFSLERLLGGRSVVVTLILLNVAVFVGDALFTPPGREVGQVSGLLSLNSENAFQPWYWWRFITYAFAHANLNHILFNMIGLFFFGRAMEGVLGPQKFFWMYMTAILAGSVVWMLGAMSMQQQWLLGASGGVVATVVLFCFFFPHQKVLFMMFIPMPAWVLGIFLVGSDLWGAIVRPEGSSIAFGVHLVGAAYAFVYYKTRWDISRLAPGNWGGAASLLKRKPKLRVHQPDQDTDDQLAREADEVLRKLHEQGEASLSPRERRILEDYSRRVKQRR